jgi:hypothetical protein
MKTLLFIAAALFSSTISHAEEAPKTKYVNALIGPVFELTGDDKNTYFGISGRFGGDIYRDGSSNLALGLMYGRNGSDKLTVGSVTSTANTSVLMAEILSRKAFDTGLYFGVRVGVGFTNLTIKDSSAEISDTATTFAYAPVIGYELPIAEKFNVNAELSLITVGGGTLKYGSTELNFARASALSFQGGVMFDWQ